jgi:hypothetical protein
VLNGGFAFLLGAHHRANWVIANDFFSFLFGAKMLTHISIRTIALPNMFGHASSAVQE